MTQTAQLTEAQIKIIARRIASRVAALPATCGVGEVYNVVAKYPAPGEAVGEAFSLLDCKPNRFADHHIWHPRIRALRNDTRLGERLFALFGQA